LLAYNKQDALRLLDDPRYTHTFTKQGNTFVRAVVSKADGSGPDLIVDRDLTKRARTFWDHLAGDIDQLWCWETWSYEAERVSDYVCGRADLCIKQFGDLENLQKQAGVKQVVTFEEYVRALHVSGYDVRIVSHLTS